MTAADPLPVDPRSLIRSRPYRALLAGRGADRPRRLGRVVGLPRARAPDPGRGLREPAGRPRLRPRAGLVAAALARARRAADRVRDPAPAGARRARPGRRAEVGRRADAPIDLPGVLLAALATLGLGLVLGPEGPLIALGMGLGILSMRLVKRDAPQQALGLMAAAGSFAAVSSIFGSPVIGAVLVLEAAGLGGADTAARAAARSARGRDRLARLHRARLVVGALSTAAWALSPFPLPPFGGPGWGDFAWTILLAAAAAVVVFAVMELARLCKRVVDTRPFVLTIVAGLAVGALAIAFAESTRRADDRGALLGRDRVRRRCSARRRRSRSRRSALLLLFKGLAWSISLGNFRGGPDVPGDLPRRRRRPDGRAPPGLRRDAGRRGLVGAACVATLRLPLSSVMIASLLTLKAGLAVTPLVIVAVVVVVPRERGAHGVRRRARRRGAHRRGARRPGGGEPRCRDVSVSRRPCRSA